MSINIDLLSFISQVIAEHLNFLGVELTPYPDIDRWILYATRNGVKKLKLKMTKDDSKRVDADIEDRFSALPRNLVDDILRLLPVHDAARTSILSKNWRYIWAAHPNLMLDKTFCSKLAVKSQSVLKETIDMILLQHIGDIVKFDLDVSGVQLCSYADIDRWMLYVTRYGVKELTLNMSKNISSTYKVPSYIFDCRTLTQLKLFKCIFKLPNSFLGFQTLTLLQLKEVTFAPAIEFYAIKTPLLVELNLTHCEGTQYLNIEFSSGLKYLSVRESHYNLDLNSNYFRNIKKLTYLYLVFDNPIRVDERLTLEKLLFSSPTLETLTLGTVPKGLHYTLNCLWHLQLGVNFNKLGQTCYTLELIKSFPNLSKLEIWDNAFGDPDEAVMKYLDAPSCLDQTLNKLEDVSIHIFRRSKVVLSFIKLLFAHAPSLSRMSIKPRNASSSKEELNVATELMRFPRVSPKAKLFYHPTVGLKAE
ncbi:hypothetical protein KY289_019447 [Solanum tuberosum]|nr:hypothetical protein KY289_019447 [Solanum tuberosum]